MTPVAYINGYRPFDFDDFGGGLNLRDKADTVGEKEAIDLLNVTLGERGAIDQRDGYADLTPADLINRVDSLSPFYTAGGLKHLIAGCGTRLEALNSLGNPIVARTGLAGGPWTFARFGDPTHEYLYAANGQDVMQRWDGASWSSGAVTATVDGVAGRAMPKAGAICVGAQHPGAASGSNASNRLIATAFGTQPFAGPGGAPTTPSRAYLSNPGQPEMWETVADLPSKRQSNWIDFTPGDGEKVMAAISWRELTFVFKETKFFVLWGENTTVDAAGNVTTTFYVREVVNAIGLASPLAVAAGRDGVYFMNRRGVYLTNGGDPKLISDILTPMWMGDPDIYFRSSPINMARLDLVRMLWHMERLYLAVPTGAAAANDRVLVYDTQHDWWSLADIPASAMASFRADVQPAITFGYSTGPQRVGRLVPGAETDRNGQTIVSRWRSGWSDYGGSQQTTLRETKVWGSGAVVVSFATNFDLNMRGNLDTVLGVPATWPADGDGTWNDWIALQGGKWPGAGQTSDALVRYAVRGSVFSTQFSNSPSSPSWSVHRVARHMRENREPSIR